MMGQTAQLVPILMHKGDKKSGADNEKMMLILLYKFAQTHDTTIDFCHGIDLSYGSTSITIRKFLFFLNFVHPLLLITFKNFLILRSKNMMNVDIPELKLE